MVIMVEHSDKSGPSAVSDHHEAEWNTGWGGAVRIPVSEALQRREIRISVLKITVP